MCLQFLTVDAINHRITNYCTSTRRPMKFFVGFCCFVYVFLFGLLITELFCVFVVFGVFQGRLFTTSVQKKFLMFFFPYYFQLIIDAHTLNFGVNSFHISGFDYRIFWVTYTARWLAITCFVGDIKVPCFPNHIAVFILTDIIIKKFLNYFIFYGNFWFEKLNFSFKISY